MRLITGRLLDGLENYLHFYKGFKTILKVQMFKFDRMAQGKKNHYMA